MATPSIHSEIEPRSVVALPPVPKLGSRSPAAACAVPPSARATRAPRHAERARGRRVRKARPRSHGWADFAIRGGRKNRKLRYSAPQAGRPLLRLEREDDLAELARDLVGTTARDGVDRERLLPGGYDQDAVNRS